MATQRTDVAIIGGGIVGLATAYRLVERRPGARVLVLEKEPALARHQTGHNSGVLHTGVYYRPGSLKAVNCREGRTAMASFCRAEGIRHEICGKVIVAVDESELSVLDEIHERGRANGVRCEIIGPERLRELEPHAAGIRALHVPDAGIVDFVEVCERLAEKVRDAGGEVLTAARVGAIRERAGSVVLESAAGEIEATHVVNCAGLHSDRIVRASGRRPEARIVPFRGEYYRLRRSARRLCRNLIYPVPDPSFPFLGVHFTRTIHGEVECGPNAVLAFAREGYRRTQVNPRDLLESLAYPGFLRLLARHWRPALGELRRSFSKRAFVKALRRLVPEIRPQDVEPAPAGVRAQAIRPDGGLVDDFLILETERVVHVCNAPSPAATASLNIGRLVAERIDGTR